MTMSASQRIHCKLGLQSIAYSSRNIHPANPEPSIVKHCDIEPTGREAIVQDQRDSRGHVQRGLEYVRFPSNATTKAESMKDL